VYIKVKIKFLVSGWEVMDIEETGVEFWTDLVLIRIGPVG